MPARYDLQSRIHWPTAHANGYFNALANRVEAYSSGHDPHGNDYIWDRVYRFGTVDYFNVRYVFHFQKRRGPPFPAHTYIWCVKEASTATAEIFE